MNTRKKILAFSAMTLVLLSVIGLSSCTGQDKFVPFSEMSEEEKDAFLMAEGFEIIDKKGEEGEVSRSLPMNEAEESEETEISEENAEGEVTEEESSLPDEAEDTDAAKNGESGTSGEADDEKEANTAEGLSGVLKDSENGEETSGESSEKTSESEKKAEEKAAEKEPSTKEVKETEKKSEPSSSGSSGSYVYNKNTKKFHVASCDSVKDMKESNKGFSNDRASLIASGYVPCKRCNP